MAKGDIEIIEYQSITPVRTYVVGDRDTSGEVQIKAGEPLKISGTTANHVVLLEGGDPEIGTDKFVGVAKNDSTETATVEGTVEVYIPVPGVTVFRCKANNPTAVNTTTKRIGLLNDYVTFDRSASDVFTVNEDEDSDAAHGLVIVDADIDHATIDFVVRGSATLYDNHAI